jgi:3-hydroxyisobutyrate dehydrogenase-like beta-hydroxyacid dehydrogenase
VTTQGRDGFDDRCGFVGLGQIGRAMVGGLVSAGTRLCVHDIDPRATDALADGEVVTRAPTPAEVAKRCWIVDVAVNTAVQVDQVVCGRDGLLDGARSGTVVLVHSTIDHATLRRVADAASAVEVDVLDAPVSGRWGEASIPDLAVMCGGRPAAFDKAEKVMGGYASLRLHLGPLGAGLDTKLALNLLRYLSMLGQPDDGAREATMLLDAAGVSAPLALLVSHTGADLRDLGPRPPVLRLPPDSEARSRHNAALARKDLRAAANRGDELGIDLSACTAAATRVQTFWGIDQWDDDDDL